MEIDAHAHVFTLRTILSEDAIRIMRRRLAAHGVPDLIARAAERFLLRLLDRPDLLDEREVLARLLGELREVSGFDSFVAAHSDRLPLNVVVRGDALDRLPLETLRAALDQLTTAMDGRGAMEAGSRTRRSYQTGAFDVVATLRLAMRSTITEVADALLEPMGPDDAIVAHMMDFHSPDESPRDRRNFDGQVAGTREAALQRPGRVLPFFAIHPRREDHFERMEAAITEGGFLGIKLYPSLGYPVDGPELRRVYRFCVEHDVPILLHCSPGGFYRDPDSIEYGDPARWEPLLAGEFEGLRVCFAHFGGWATLGRTGGLSKGTWGGTILRLMRERAHVYADLAFHTDQISEPDDERRYFETLARLLADPHLQRRIMFGTDAWLLRLEMTSSVFRQYYRENLAPAEFRAISQLAPRAFLGFPEPGDPAGPTARSTPRANLRRHLDFLARHADSVGADPPEWVKQLGGQPFVVDREPADWHRKSPAARAVYRLARPLLPSGGRRAGFRANREFPLRELRYFRPRDPNFERLICPGLARDLVGALEDSGGFAPGWGGDAALERFTEVFVRGEKRLLELAGMADHMFEFERGLQ